MIGETVSHYRVICRIGVGGMGVVYEAEDTRLHRRVALKFLPDEVCADDATLQRFRREAETASALNHPHICTVHDIGVHNGRPFIVMEKLDGTTLGHLIGARPMPVDRVLRLGGQIADALAAAHRARIVHRDIKPANIFVTSRGDAKLLDFGLARLDHPLAAAAEDTATNVRPADLTMPGVTLGTIAYMSPEQARGETVDSRSDVFSFGAVLYEMVTGVQAFGRPTFAAIAAAILAEPVPPPSRLNPDTPPELDGLILAALEKDRERRLTGAAELRADLLRMRGDRSAPRVAPAAARRRLAIVAAIALLVVAAGGLWFAGARRPNPPAITRERRLAVLPFENLGAPEDDYFAEGMTDEVRGKLAALRGLEVIARASSDEYKGARKPPRQIAQELGVPYLLTGKIRWQRSGSTSRIRLSPELVEISGSGTPVTRWQDEYDADLADVFDVQARIAGQVAAALEVALAAGQDTRLEQRPTSNLGAYDAYLKGVEMFSRGFSAAIDRDAALLFERAVALDPNFAMAWAYLSLSQSMRYSWGAPTPEVADAARAAAERAMALSPELPKAHMALGVYERVVTLDNGRAADVFRRGLTIAPDDADLLRNLGFAEGENGNPEGSLTSLRRSAELDPRSWQSQLALSSTLIFLHRPREAREAADRGLALKDNINLFQDRVFAYLEEGDLAGARGAMAHPPKGIDVTALISAAASSCMSWVLTDEQRGVLRRLTPSAFDDQEATWALALADAFWLAGDMTQARTFAERAEAAYRETMARGPTSPMQPAYRGYALALLGRTGEAGDEAKRSLTLSKNAVTRGRAVRWLALTYAVAGDDARTIATVEEALKSQTYVTPAYLRIDPHFVQLRGNPRFAQLMR